MTRLPLLALLLLLALAPGAAAQSRVTVIGGSHGLTEGPVFAGDTVAWAIRTAPDEIAIRIAAPDGTVAPATTVSTPRGRPSFVRLSGAPGKLAIVYGDIRCDDRACRVRAVGFARSLIGPPGGPFTTFASCDPGSCKPPDCYGPLLVASATAVAYSAGCSEVVIQGDDGSRARVPATEPLALRGDFVADWRFPEWAVINWRTGETRLTVKGQPLVMDEDGSVVVTTGPDESGRHGLSLVSPGRAAPTRLPVSSLSAISSVAVDRGIVAYARFNEVGVISDGNARQVETFAIGRVALAGRRLAWTTRPCGLTLLVVWDLGGPAPPVRDRCSMPTLRGGLILLTSERARGRACSPCDDLLAVPIACPRASSAGCAGWADATGRLQRFPTETYRLEPGARGHALVRVRRGSVRPGRTVTVSLSAFGSGARAVTVRRRVGRGAR